MKYEYNINKTKNFDEKLLYQGEAEKYKNLALRSLNQRAELYSFIDDFIYIIELLAENPLDIKSWFKAKELLIKYKEYKLKNQ